MKFSACVLTTALLIATAATVHSSALDPIVLNFGVLDDDIFTSTTPCDPVGTITALTFTNCSQSTYPCNCQQSNDYTVTPTFTCGAKHTNCQILVTMNVMGTDVTVFKVPSDMPLPLSCNAGDTVSPLFVFTVPSSTPPGDYDLKMKLSCDNGNTQQIDWCRGIKIKVN